MNIATLVISSWKGISIGAVHYYAELFIDIDNKLEIIKLKRKITSKEAISMNAEAKAQGYLAKHYSPKDLTEGFNSERSAINFGIKYFNKSFKGILCLGEYACHSPWKTVISYPEEAKEIVEKMNKISKEFISLNGYEGDHRSKVETLNYEWGNLYEQLIKL